MVDGPVIFGGVRVAPRDLVLGDDDGLVIVPNLLVDSKLRLHRPVEFRDRWEEALVSGRSTLDVFNVPPAVRASNQRKFLASPYKRISRYHGSGSALNRSMSRSRKVWQRSTSLIARNSSALWACSIDPGPQTTETMPPRVLNAPASVP